MLAGLGLLGNTIYALTCSLRQDSVSDDHWKILTVFTGLLLGVILFTGFLQLGSRYSVHQFIIYKLIATASGGTLALIALVGRLNQSLPELLQDGLFVIAVFLFGVSLYMGIVI